MSEYYSVANRGSRPTSSWWKYALIIFLGIIIALVAIFGIKTIMVGSQAKSDSLKSAGAASAQSGKTSPKKSKASDQISLGKEFCSKPSGICFNYPANWKPKVEKESSDSVALRWEKYNIHFLDSKGNEALVVQDYLHDIGGGCPEEGIPNLPPLHILETTRTNIYSVDPNAGRMTTYAIKDVYAERQQDGSLKYQARMYLTQHPGLFKPGKIDMTCELGDLTDVVSINGTSLRVILYDLDFTSKDALQFDSYEEAVQAFNNPVYKKIWKILQSAHN